MKYISSFFCLLFFVVIPIRSYGATKTVTISWKISGAATIQGYKMYYSYDNGLANKMLACETNDTAITSLTCSNIDLSQSPVYFAIAALTTTGEKISSISTQTFTTSTIQKPEILRLTLVTTTPTTGLASYAINFQPTSVAVPEGFITDSGKSYDANKGFGWTISPGTNGARDREIVDSPDQSYDTLLLVDPTGIWEIALDNGTYLVSICVGDPWWAYSTNVINVEGIQIVNDTVSSAQRWIEKTGTVTVNDGRLTMTFQGSTPHAQLCWIKISHKE